MDKFHGAYASVFTAVSNRINEFEYPRKSTKVEQRSGCAGEDVIRKIIDKIVETEAGSALFNIDSTIGH